MSKKKTLKSIQQGMVASTKESGGSVSGFNDVGNAGKIQKKNY